MHTVSRSVELWTNEHDGVYGLFIIYLRVATANNF